MNPINDIVCTLIETPFSQWKDDDKLDVLKYGRPTKLLSICIRKENKKTGKAYNIKSKAAWFRDFTWLCSSPIVQRLFCWPCLLFSNKLSVWVRQGFGDFQNIIRSLRKHEDSAEHLKCSLRLQDFEKNRNTINTAHKDHTRLLLIQFNENVRLNRCLLQLIIDAVLLNSRSYINRQHFKELLELLIPRSSLEIQNHYKKINNVFCGHSNAIQNEVINCISEYIQDYVLAEINSAIFFSIHIDDAVDINGRSQCFASLRFINLEGVLVDRFLGYYDVTDDMSSDGLFYFLDGILTEFSYQSKLVAHCYDGASIMSEELRGLQQKIKDEAPQAILVHSLAHHLNDSLQQCLKTNSRCHIFFSVITEMYNFFRYSGKQVPMINSITDRIIQPLGWSSDLKLIHVVIEDGTNLKQIFETIMSDEKSDSRAIGLSKKFFNDTNNFEFMFLAVVFNDIFCLTDVLLYVLQKSSLDINYCISKIKSTCEILNNKRSNEFFTTMFEKTKRMTNITHQRRKWSKLSDDEIFQNYQMLFYEILDNILKEMHDRFKDYKKLQFFNLVDTTQFQKYTADFPVQAFENLRQCYPHIFNKPQRLQNELYLLYGDEIYRNISTQSVHQLLQENQDVFEETYKLFSLVLTIPSTSISTKNYFSYYEKIRTYLRTTISREKLSSFANISVQEELIYELMKKQPVYEDIIDKFASLKDRTIDLVYKH